MKHGLEELHTVGADSLKGFVCIRYLVRKKFILILNRIEVRSKWKMRADQRIKDDTKAPDVRLEVSWLVHHDLGGHEGCGASALDESLTRLQEAGKAKVANLYFGLVRRITHKNVQKLEVPMHELSPMQVFDSFRYLNKDVEGSLF